MIKFQFFPRSVEVDERMSAIVDCFLKVDAQIASPEHDLSSNGVLALVKPHLEPLGFKVEAGKKRNEKIKVPVLFGLNNKIDKFFDADAVSQDGKIVVGIEAGRALDNYQFLKDIFQASMMSGVDYLVMAVRNSYRGGRNFDRIFVYLETLYISGRIQLPLRGILLIGY
jgi:hypothetical protein